MPSGSPSGSSGNAWQHANHWDSGPEADVGVAAVNLGAVVAANKVRRITEITIRHSGSNNTVVRLLVGAVIRLSIDVPAQTTRVWSSLDGRSFTAGQQPTITTSDVTGGHTFVSASGVEA